MATEIDLNIGMVVEAVGDDTKYTVEAWINGHESVWLSCIDCDGEKTYRKVLLSDIVVDSNHNLFI